MCSSSYIKAEAERLLENKSSKAGWGIYSKIPYQKKSSLSK
jgi:hypothetical protein